MEVSCLIGLREGVMVRDSSAIVAEATEVALRPLLFLYGDGHDFDLVIGEADLDFKLVRHHELVSFNRVIVILLLLSDLIAFLSHHLLLHLLLLELLRKKETKYASVTNLVFPLRVQWCNCQKHRLAAEDYLPQSAPGCTDQAASFASASRP